MTVKELAILKSFKKKNTGCYIPIFQSFCIVVVGNTYVITELLKADSGIVLVVVDDGFVQPPSLVLQLLRQIPVIQGNKGNDVLLLQGCYKSLVVVHTLLADAGFGTVR